MNFSLKSRLNLIIVCIFVFLLLAAALQIAISKFLLQSKPILTKYMIESFGYTIKLDGISFSWLRGIQLKGLSFFYRPDDTAVAYLKDASITLRLLPLFLKKLSINRININDATLSLKKGDGGVNLQIIFSDIYKNLCESKSAKFQIDIRNLSIYTRYATLIYADEESPIKGAKLFFRNAHIDIYKSGKLNFKSELKFTQQIPKGHYLFRFLNREAIEQDLKCSLQATLSNQDLNIDMFLINLAKEQIIGMGRIKDSLGRNPEVNIIFIPSTLSLDSITFLKDNFSPDGQMLVSLKFLGKMDDIKPWISANLDNCNFSYHLTNNEVFDIENMNGKIEYIDGSIKLENIFLKLNSVPLNITLETNVSQEPSILLRVALPRGYLLAQKLPIQNLETNFKGRLKNTLTGELDIKTLYRRMDSVFQMQAYFKNLDFDYHNLQEKYLRCDSLTLIKKDGDNLQKLDFINFDSKAILTKNRLNLKDISFTGYNGEVEADINIDLKDKPPVLSFNIEGQGLDIKKIMSDTHITKKLLSGTLDIEITFNNSLKEFLKGNATVKDGLADLSALSEGIKLPPLKNLNFEVAKLSFAISKELISIRDVKLTSADILMNAYWQISRAVNGELDLEMGSKFLNTSVQFKKLLSLTRIKKPYIDFKFLLGGVPQAIRFMWMKGEFKEKIEEALPTGIKKSIEANLDKMVEDLSNK